MLIGPRPYDPIEEAVVIETTTEETPLVVPADDTIALPESQDSKNLAESNTEVSGEDGVDK